LRGVVRAVHWLNPAVVADEGTVGEVLVHARDEGMKCNPELKLSPEHVNALVVVLSEDGLSTVGDIRLAAKSSDFASVYPKLVNLDHEIISFLNDELQLSPFIVPESSGAVVVLF
jgi:hypothetical protein